MIQSINTYIKDEYHAVHKMLWKTGYTHTLSRLPPREDKPTGPLDACRFHGTLLVNKLAGNLHVTAGKPVHGLGGHAHLSLLTGFEKLNFSHRIERLSFGEYAPGVINPLDGDEKVTQFENHLYQYFIKVVPTTVNTNAAKADTHQYSCTERNREINHAGGSHGVPGIYFKYDVAGLKIHVTEQHKPYWQFLVRLCGIVGGIFATSGMLHSLVGFIYDVICCRYKLGSYRESSVPAVAETIPLHHLGSFADDELDTSSHISIPSFINQNVHQL